MPSDCKDGDRHRYRGRNIHRSRRCRATRNAHADNTAAIDVFLGNLCPTTATTAPSKRPADGSRGHVTEDTYVERWERSVAAFGSFDDLPPSGSNHPARSRWTSCGVVVTSYLRRRRVL